jgi:hypothetical protein
MLVIIVFREWIQEDRSDNLRRDAIKDSGVLVVAEHFGELETAFEPNLVEERCQNFRIIRLWRKFAAHPPNARNPGQLGPGKS